MIENSIWITWEIQRRNRELSKALGIRLYEFSELDGMRNRLIKYIMGIAKTYNVISKVRPGIVFGQNPSLVLSFFLVLFKSVFHMWICIDAHNSGIFPKEGQSKLLGILSRFIQRRADLTIVTNEPLKRHVEDNGGRSYVLQDKIPSIPSVAPLCLRGKFNILFICTYAADEPYEEVFNAARNIDKEVSIYVTGNYINRGIIPEGLPENLILTGFLSEDKYIEILHSVDATMVLTRRKDCLVCGAYESLAVGKPMILSDTRALREYFASSAVYTINNSRGIECAVQEILERKREIAEHVQQVKTTRDLEWEVRKAELERVVHYAVKTDPRFPH